MSTLRISLVLAFAGCLGCGARGDRFDVVSPPPPPSAHAATPGTTATVRGASPSTAEPEERAGGVGELDATSLAPPLTLRAAWVVTAAPTEVEQVEAALYLIVNDSAGKQEGIEVGRWWREQKGVLEPLEPSDDASHALFTTRASFAAHADDDSEKAPRSPVDIAVRRRPNGDVMVITLGSSPRLQARVRIPAGAELRTAGVLHP